jgi:hypothetical protein
MKCGLKVNNRPLPVLGRIDLIKSTYLLTRLPKGLEKVQEIAPFLFKTATCWVVFVIPLGFKFREIKLLLSVYCVNYLRRIPRRVPNCLYQFDAVSERLLVKYKD